MASSAQRSFYRPALAYAPMDPPFSDPRRTPARSARESHRTLSDAFPTSSSGAKLPRRFLLPWSSAPVQRPSSTPAQSPSCGTRELGLNDLATLGVFGVHSVWHREMLRNGIAESVVFRSARIHVSVPKKRPSEEFAMSDRTCLAQLVVEAPVDLRHFLRRRARIRLMFVLRLLLKIFHPQEFATWQGRTLRFHPRNGGFSPIKI